MCRSVGRTTGHSALELTSAQSRAYSRAPRPRPSARAGVRSIALAQVLPKFALHPTSNPLGHAAVLGEAPCKLRVFIVKKARSPSTPRPTRFLQSPPGSDRGEPLPLLGGLGVVVDGPHPVADKRHHRREFQPSRPTEALPDVKNPHERGEQRKTPNPPPPDTPVEGLPPRLFIRCEVRNLGALEARQGRLWRGGNQQWNQRPLEFRAQRRRAEVARQPFRRAARSVSPGNMPRSLL